MGGSVTPVAGSAKPMSTIDQIRARREQSPVFKNLRSARAEAGAPAPGTATSGAKPGAISPRMSEFLSKQRM